MLHLFFVAAVMKVCQHRFRDGPLWLARKPATRQQSQKQTNLIGLGVKCIVRSPFRDVAFNMPRVAIRMVFSCCAWFSCTRSLHDVKCSRAYGESFGRSAERNLLAICFAKFGGKLCVKFLVKLLARTP